MLATPFVTHQTLRDRIREGMTMNRAVDLLAQIAEIMISVHRRRIAHLDLKPENVLVTDRNRVHLIDWGVSQTFSAASRDVLDLSTRVVGTPGYMAPEQALGMRCDAATDVFAIGAMLCEILSGSPAYRGEHVARLARSADLHDARQRLTHASVDSNLAALAWECLQVRRRDRIGDAARLARTLRRNVS